MDFCPKGTPMELSLIIPIFNTEKWLIECLDSARNAVKGLDAEVLLIDDGSTDGSSKMAKEYADKNPGFKYFRKDNGGLSDARNYGIAHSEGKYIAFFDSDDKVDEHIYRDMLYMAKLHDAPITICNITRFNDKGAVLVSPMYQKVFSSPPTAVTSIRQDLNLVYDTMVCNKLILRSFWDEHDLSFPVGKYYEDGPISIRLHWYADRVAVLPFFGQYYRIRGNGAPSITQQLDSINVLEDKLEMENNILSFLKEKIGEPGVGDILITEQKKILDFSIEATLLALYQMKEETQVKFIELIGDFLKKEISGEALEQMSLYNRIKYRLLVSGDRQSLLQLMNHKRLAWRTMPVIDISGRPMLILPEEIYKKSMTEAPKEIPNDIPLTRISDIRNEEDNILLDMTVYYPRISIPDPECQKISAYLYCEFTGRKIPLKTSGRLSPELTEEKGKMVCNDDFKVYEYNYDGAGVTVTCPKETLQSLDHPGRWFLGISFDTKIAKGERLVRSISPEAKSFITNKLNDKDLGIKVTGRFDKRESFFFEVS